MTTDLVSNSLQIFLGTVFGGVALVMLIESMVPLRAEPKAPLLRWVNNLSLAAVDYAVLFGIAPLTTLLFVQFLGFAHTGLLHWSGASYLASFILLLLCLEFLGYWIHRAFHAVPMLWRIHAVHHSDVEVDATTANRHHPLELVISNLAIVPALVLLAPDPLVLLGCNVLHAIVGVSTHGNFSLAPSVDRVLRLAVVTPDFHRVHHCAERSYTDSNYSTTLPLFDYLFRTATQRSREQQKSMPLGLPYFRERKYARLDQLLFLPFRNFTALPQSRAGQPRSATSDARIRGGNSTSSR